VLAGGTNARHVVDLHRVLGGGTPRIMSAYDGGDGLHPNRLGRVAMARAISRRIS
jgi:lysophospholipase L1-like esterase